MEATDKAEDNFFLEGTVKNFEAKEAIVKLSGGQEIKWPIKNLPEDAEVGSQVKLVLSTAVSAQEEREKIAKTILNQILKTENQSEQQQKK